MAGSMTSAFFPASLAPASASKNAMGAPAISVDVRGVAAMTSTPSAAVRAGRRATRLQALIEVNGGKEAVNNGEEEKEKKEVVAVNFFPAPSTFDNQRLDWSTLFAAFTAIFFAAENRRTLLQQPDRKPKLPENDMLTDGAFGLGRIVDGGRVFRQDFPIRSYEIGADKTASIETLMNHLQETALNHVKSVGLLGDGLGSTPEMSKRDLFWVICQMQVHVEHYPSWGDTVGIDTWVSGHGKSAMRRDWHLRDLTTGKTILKATSKSMMVHRLTRKISRIPDEVRAEIGPYFFERGDIPDEANLEIPKQPEHCAAAATKYARTGLSPRWSDLDINQHVNNVKYIGWILESAPISILEKHELASLVLQYKRECCRDSVLQSQTTVFGGESAAAAEGSGGEPTALCCEHLLSLESGPTILKAKPMWRPKEPWSSNQALLSVAKEAA